MDSDNIPPWVDHLLRLARPGMVAATVAIPAVGAFCVGLAGLLLGQGIAMQMVRPSVAFLQGIPEALYLMIGSIALGYTGAKSFESMKAKPPVAPADSPPPAPPAPDMSPPPADELQ